MPVEFSELRGELVDLCLHQRGLVGHGLLAVIDPFEDRLHGVRAHVSRQVSAVADVSRRVMTSVMAQYTRDSALWGRWSYSRTRRRYINKIP
ncbi:hypothetical protein [Streptomyces sp. 2A115]|uniref:hypothetical protein n=1 Tax=Streptomyces sp. 2A115 TaxID=3457439 RepID=UPI003FD45BC6